MLVLEIGTEDLDLRKLTECQQNAIQGLYAQAMAGFARYLAGRYEKVCSRLRTEHAALREAASRGGQHRRTPSLVADLALGLRHFLFFALEAGAISEEDAWDLWARGWQTLGEAADAQATHQAANEPTQRFAELLSAAVASGRAHVAGPTGDIPNPKEHDPAAWGWHGEVRMDEGKTSTAWKYQGERIGWLDGEDLFLQPEASFGIAQKQGRDSGDALAVTGRTLRKRLHEHGLLVSTDKNRQVLTVRRTLADWRREVLHLSSGFLSSPPPGPDQTDHDHGKPHVQAGSIPPLRSGEAPPDLPTPDRRPDQEQGGRVEWSGSRVVTRASDQEPDQRDSREQAEDQPDGRVGRVLADKRGEGLDKAMHAEERERFTL